MDPGAEREVRVPEVVDPRPRVQVEPHPPLGEQGVRHVDRNHALHGCGFRRLAPDQRFESREVLRHVGEVRVSLDVGHDDRAHRLHVGRDVERDPSVTIEGCDALLDPQVLSPHEHGRAADDLDVAEPETLEVVLGQLAPDADRRGPVEHGARKRPHRLLDRLEAPGVIVERSLCADAEDHDRDPEPLDDLRQSDQQRLVAQTERVRQRDDVGVVVGVDPGNVPGADGEAIGQDLDPGSRQDLVGRLHEHEVAAVGGDQVGLEGRLGRRDLERVLAGPEKDPLHIPVSS